MELFERIKHLRKNELHLTQDELASKIKVSRSNLASIEIGRISVTDRVVNDICMAYNVNEEWLRTGEGEIFNEGNPLIVESILETFQELNPEFQEYARRQIHELLELQKRHDAQAQEVSADKAKAADVPDQEDHTGEK